MRRRSDAGSGNHVILTLATNYDWVYRDLLMHFLVSPGVFIFAVVLAAQIARRRWNWAFSWAVVWGLAFPFVRVLLVEVEGTREFMGSDNKPVSWNGSLYASVSYLVIVLVVWLVALRKWSRAFTWVLAWALAFPLAWAITQSCGGGGHSVVGGNSVTTALTAVLLWRATRSWIPAVGCAGGLLAAEVGFDLLQSPLADRSNEMWAASLVWGGWVFVSLMVWAWRNRPLVGRAGFCAACGYDLRGTLGRPCPECGRGPETGEVGGS